MRILLTMCMLFFSLPYNAQVAYDSFVSPPKESQAWTYWMWVNGNATKEGVQKDLEAMDEVGINGAIILDVDQQSPNGDILFGGKKWRQVFRHAAKTAERLGMSIGVNNGPGYWGTGGKWIEPELALQWVVCSETYVGGGQLWKGKLKKPGAGTDYKDIAVIAVNRIDTMPANRYTVDDFILKIRQNPGNQGRRRYAAAPYTLKQLKAFSYPGYIGYRGVSTGDLNKEIPHEKVLPMSAIVDISDKMDKEGNISWEVPPGNWTIIRFGHQWSGSCVGPVVKDVEGPEIDRLNPEALKRHFDSIIVPLKEWANSKSLSLIHTDSWEGGGMNWTPGFDSIFYQRRGYEILPWLPVFTGRIVSSLEETERFMYDLRKTISELFIQNYMEIYNRLLKEKGLKLSAECYTTPSSDMDASYHVDVPMAEFWAKGMGFNFVPTMKLMASSAQVRGRNIVAAEALTASRTERWLMHPAKMKTQIDEAFCHGINRMVFHRYTQQNFDYPGPGNQMNVWGCKYERTNTWWSFSKPWHTYISRCQYILQNSTAQADVLVILPEEPGFLFQGLKLEGYDYTIISTNKVNELRADDQGVHLPNRPPYKLVVLLSQKTMSVEMMAKIKDLVNDGAAILGDKPQWVYGLYDYKQREERLKLMADELWGDSSVMTSRKVGKGIVFSNISIEAALNRVGLSKDFESDQELNYIHVKDQEHDIYFLSNPLNKTFEAKCNFRMMGGGYVQLWNPETGKRYKLDTRQLGTQSQARIPFTAEQSWFVIGGLPDTDSLEEYPKKNIVQSFMIDGEWHLNFLDGLGAPEEMCIPSLMSWSMHEDKNIKYYSGKVSYKKDVFVAATNLNKKRQIYLDLGRVEVMAQLFINGEEVGIGWRNPFIFDITHYIKPGKNKLEIVVVNLWPNRLIGDEQYPDDIGYDEKGNLSSWPKWLINNKKRPTSRQVFSARRQWNAEDELLPSGLLGPVRILFMD